MCGRETLGGHTEYWEELRGGVLSGWQLRGEGPEWKGGFMDVIKLNDRSALHIKMLLFFCWKASSETFHWKSLNL